MQDCFEITDREIEEYSQQLEDHLPSQIDGIDFQGQMMVRFAYVPGSVSLNHVDTNPEQETVTPCHSCWTYKVTRAELSGDCFIPTATLEGFIVLLIDANGILITEEADFLGGLLCALESDYSLNASSC
jgi:hypothetical protein